MCYCKCVTKQHLLDQVIIFIFQPPFIWTKKEIRVKSTKLKYKNKGLKLKSIYEYNLHIHPVLWIRMTALWEWQYSSYGKRGAWTSQNALFRQLRSHLGLSEVYELVAWIFVMISSGLKANSKKIEGRLFESHPRAYLSSSPHFFPSGSHRLVCRSRRPVQRRGQFHYPEKLNRKPNRAVCAMCGLLRWFRCSGQWV